MRQSLLKCITIAVAFVAVPQCAQPAAVVVVTDADLVGNIYDFRYDPRTNSSVSGSTVIAGDPWLTNTGWVRFSLANAWTLSPPGLGVRYNGGPIESTVGFDFSGMNRRITMIEMENRHVLFRWKADIALGAEGDTITGQIATPTSIGSGAFSTIYTHIGDGVISNTVQGIENTALRDITGGVGGSWLADPDLLELKFTYAPDSNHSGTRRIFTDTAQLFRDRFHLRVTTAAASSGVPEPASLGMWSAVAFCGGAVAMKRRRRRRKKKGV